MKFDVVIGNPPYNNDLYLDFVQTGYNLLKDDGVMVQITPAKWQAKGGKKNEDFRANIVPHMKEIVYYPDCTDVFPIGEVSGVCYYTITKSEYSTKSIKNSCKLQKLFNDDSKRCISNRETLLNTGNIVCSKPSILNAKKISLLSYPKDRRYQVWTNNKVAIGGGKAQGTFLFSNEGMMQYLSISRLVDKTNLEERKTIIVDSQLIFSSDDKQICEYFMSFIYTRLVRFLLLCNTCGLTGVANPNSD